MKKESKTLLTFRIVCLMLAVVTALPLWLAGCGGTKHVCTSQCPTCGYCLNKDCKEKACELKCPGHKDEKATIESVEVTVLPKTEYYPGEVFDITGLAVKATLSNKKTKKFFYNNFTEWTHKDEPLTEEVNKITFTVPGYDFTFDIDITVGIPEGMTLILDTTALKEEYNTDEKINFNLVKVKTNRNGQTETVDDKDWMLYNGNAKFSDKTSVSAADLGTGEITLTVEHVSGLKTTFTVKIVDAKNVITPSVIDAEDNVYMLENNVETETKYTRVESNTQAEYMNDGAKSNVTLYNGFNGRGMVTNIDKNYNSIYFKFKVNVPATGKYNLSVRAQHINYDNGIKNKFSININGAKDSSGNFVFTKNAIDQTIICGNQLKNYCTLTDEEKANFKGYYNMFWWSSCKLGTFELQKGDNEIRVYLTSKLEANIDCFEVTYADEASAGASIFSMRTKEKQSLNGKTLYLAKGEKLTDLVKTPAKHPVKYTLLYLRTSAGRDIPVLESMLEGKIDYEKVGEAQLIEVTDPVSKETASFTLFIEDVKE